MISYNTLSLLNFVNVAIHFSDTKENLSNQDNEPESEKKKENKKKKGNTLLIKQFNRIIILL